MPHNVRDTYGARRANRRSRAAVLFDLVMLVLTVVCAALLACAYFARWIDPNTAWFFAFTGLIAPMLYIANIMLALFWVLRWRRIAFIPAAVLVAGVGSIPLFFRPSLSKQYDKVQPGTLTVMTYNVVGFLDVDRTGRAVSTLDSIAAFVRRIDPDILCMQEFQSRSAADKARIDAALGMPHSVVNNVLRNAADGGWGTAVYSRFPIVGSGTVIFDGSTNSAVWADLLVGRDTLRVFNNHLQTTSVSRSERDWIDNADFLRSGDGAREERVRRIASKLRTNFRVRAAQADSLAPMIAATPHEVIVCGDFNDTPISYTYHRMRGDLKDAFVEKGRGMPNTFKGLFNLFRIDYILHSGGIEVYSYSSPPGGYSDHKPVVVGFEFKPAPR